MFGSKHIIWLIITLILIAVAYVFSKKLRFEKLIKTLFYIGLVSETIKIFYYITHNETTHGGILPKTDLPFHLCSIQIVFLVILNISKNEKLKRILLSFMLPSCLIGGLAALLIPTSTAINGTIVITAQYFLYHGAIMVFALNILLSKEISLTVKDYFSCLKFLVPLMFFAIYINSILYDGVSNINFMYVASPPVSGLPFLNEDKGWLVYILRYALVVLLAVTICYIKPIVKAIKASVSNKKSQKTE